MPSHARKLTHGALALVTDGPSAGKVVRLERMAYAPPGSAGCALHTLQPPGPIWVVNDWVEWDIWSEDRGWWRLRCKAAPVTALQPVTLH